MSGRALRFKRMLRKKAESVTRQTRAVGSRDGTTGQAALTYTVETAIFGVVGRATSRSNPQESGSVTDTVREFQTQDIILRGDRIVLADGTYEVETKPDEVREHGVLLIRKTVLRRLEFV